MCSRDSRAAGRRSFSRPTTWRKSSSWPTRSRSSRRAGSSRSIRRRASPKKHADQTRLTLESIDAAALGLIRKMGFVPTQAGDGNIRVQVEQRGRRPRHPRGNPARRPALAGLDVRKPNLEEVFLKLTGGAPRRPRRRRCRMTPRIIAANLGVRLRSFYREKSAMFFTFAFPVILVLVFGTIFTKPEHLNFDLPVQDLSRTESSATLLEALAADQTFKITAGPHRRRCHAIRQGAQAEPRARDPQELRPATESAPRPDAAPPTPCRSPMSTTRARRR